MSEPRYKTPRNPRESQLVNGFGSPQGVAPDAPAGGGGLGRFTSLKQLGTGSVASLQSQTGPRDAKDSVWVRRTNLSFAESADSNFVEDLWDKGRRAKNVVHAYNLAKDKYVGPMILQETGQALHDLLSGLIPGLLMMLIVVAATTVLGAAIGGVIGFFFGGVGAVPGAALGADIGFDFGLWLLNWLGIGFLIIYVADHLGEVMKVMSSGVERAWQAGKRQKSEQEDIDQSAHEIARAVAILVRLILEGIVLFLLEKGAAAVAERVGSLSGSLKESKLGKGFAEWIEKNYQQLLKDPRINRRLRETERRATETDAKKAPVPEKANRKAEPRKAESRKEEAKKEETKKEENKEENPVRTAAQDRAEISRLSNEADALRKQGRTAEADAKIAEARKVLEPQVEAKDWDALVERLDLSTPRDKSTFWSGDKEGAKAFAEQTGRVTLETTPGGRVLDNWERPEFNWDSGGEELWSKVSEKYANGASGIVEVVQTPERYEQGGGYIWKKVEKGILEDRKDRGIVTEINYNVLPPK
ncbi:MAG: hypothetical protein J2P41_12930 [Blastocatellia bacterium]|nr:hypothetical protein [Blastocatellia bacterium]